MILNRKPNRWWGSYLRLLVAGALVLAVTFRLGNLSTKPYWEDEVFTSMRVSGYTLALVREQFDRRIVSAESLFQYQDVVQSGQSWGDSLSALSSRPEHAPLYFVLARAWAQVFGSSPGAMRAFPAITSLLTLPLFYGLARLLFNAPATASITLCLACVSPILIRQAQEARPYSLWIVGILASSTMLLRALRSNRRSAWMIYSLTVALTFWTHLLSGIVFAIHGLYVLILQRYAATSLTEDSASVVGRLGYQTPLAPSRIANFGRFLLLGTLPILPWLGWMFYRISSVKAVTSWQNTDKPLDDMLFGWTRNVSYLVLDWIPRDRWLIFAILWLLLFTWAVFRLLSASQLRQWLLPILFCLVPSVLLIVPDLLFGGIRSLIPRYSIPIYLGLILILGFAFSYCRPQSRRSATASRYSYFQKGLFHIVLVLMIAASWHNLHASVWWRDSRLFLVQVPQAVTQSAAPAVLVSDYRLSNVMSIGRLLRPTDSLFWLPRGKGDMDETDIDKIINSSDHVFLYQPSDNLLSQLEASLAERQIAIEKTETENLYQLIDKTEAEELNRQAVLSGHPTRK
ncbi:glycosyltransferase family 39 protein [cf. Phormidesmis sp. LEGE 11477]|uniref:glycosyltransferase family 39 protein n=1 Tax=cf. Phormidesmis sp. LEGE 11477 TaxID=1828680 RepID=UPI0018812087|nr:glycosyltransferase family 39 protein [cf. Phormidesmis sp. LEGE 11477]MBE9060231.1 glycosyltransferase family 39 protein [cf. Phormidesmis sp. LEGE 11477]